MFNITSKYLSFFNNKPPARWVVHTTRDFLTYYSCSYYSSMVSQTISFSKNKLLKLICIWFRISGKLSPGKLPPRKLPPRKLPTRKLPPMKIPPMKLALWKLPPQKFVPEKIAPYEIPPHEIPSPLANHTNESKIKNTKFFALKKAVQQHTYQNNQGPFLHRWSHKKSWA